MDKVTDAMVAGETLAHAVDIDQHMGMSVNEGYQWLQRNTAGLDHFATSRWLAGFYSVLCRRIYNVLKEHTR